MAMHINSIAAAAKQALVNRHATLEVQTATFRSKWENNLHPMPKMTHMAVVTMKARVQTLRSPPPRKLGNEMARKAVKVYLQLALGIFSASCCCLSWSRVVNAEGMARERVETTTTADQTYALFYPKFPKYLPHIDRKGNRERKKKKVGTVSYRGGQQ